MLILSYSRQLKMLAAEHKVPLLDAVKQAGLPRSTYYRSIEGDTQIRLDKAKQIADAIVSLSAH